MSINHLGMTALTVNIGEGYGTMADPAIFPGKDLLHAVWLAALLSSPLKNSPSLHKTIEPSA
jgi:hypothetical protein